MSQSALTSRTLPQALPTEHHPPDTNRGVETSKQGKNTYTTECIDWISFTVPFGTDKVWPNGMDTVSTTTKSFNGYDTAKEYADGRIELTSSTRSDMGTHCVLSGTTCANCRDRLSEILEHMWLLGGKCTRFDLALDDLMGRVHPRDASEYIKRGEINCRAKEYPKNEDARGGGYTQYCGKMASEVHVCIYEKDAEQGISGFRTRIEIRFKGRKADKAAREYLRSNDCRGLILGFISFSSWDAWNEVFKTEAIKISAEKVDSRRVRWLLGQVSKSIALEISERQGDMEILTLIRESVMMKLSDIRHVENVA